MTDQERKGRAAAAASTLVITNVTKIAGIVVFLNETLIRPTGRDSVIASCALFVLGAQAAENVILRAIDRLFAGSGSRKTEGDG